MKANGIDFDLSALIAAQRAGHSLDQAFYGDPAIYAVECDRVVFRHWHYACHISQIPEAGCYRLFDVGGESFIVVRQKDGGVKALVNVCRHRGSRVCWAAGGKARSFVCPYHGWAYGLDGKLLAARMMPEDLDKESHGLSEIAAQVYQGLVLIHFDPPGGDFEAASAALDESLAPFELARTKVAAAQVWRIDANWKLAVENYRECYHCSPAHPEFAKSHSIKRPYPEIGPLVEAMRPKSEAAGAPVDTVGSEFGNLGAERMDYHYDRYPLYEGYVTGSEDGQLLGPLLGRLTGFDGGASNFSLGRLCYLLIYSDHAVVYRFTPTGPKACDCEIVWLVHQDAKEGRDYDLERLTWLWRVTTDADKAIIEQNQLGVDSRYYRPGPYAPMEDYALIFRDWYLEALAD